MDTLQSGADWVYIYIVVIAVCIATYIECTHACNCEMFLICIITSYMDNKLACDRDISGNCSVRKTKYQHEER